MAPAREQIATGNRLSGGGELIFRALVEVTLHRHQIARGGPVEAEPDLRFLPIVLRVRSGGGRVVGKMEETGLCAIPHLLSNPPAILKAGSLFEVAAAELQRSALSVGRIARGD